MDTEIAYAPRTARPLWERQSWLGTATLESVVEVNEQVLALLREQCRVAPTPPSLLRDVANLMLSLDAQSLRCAAGSGVLLVDAQFADARLWSEAIVGAVNDRSPCNPSPFFTVDGTVAVMRLVVTHAWHLARSEPAAARLLLGVSAANLAVIGGCSLSRLTHLAEARTEWLRPRWETRPRVWCNLLRTAGAGDSRAMERLRVRAVQLLAADAQPG
jgi:hypothetical protein